jgi:hypothetical protein
MAGKTTLAPAGLAAAELVEMGMWKWAPPKPA